MRQYLDLLRAASQQGVSQASRAVLASTGARPRTRSLFGYQNRYDLGDGFPLVTTKFVPFRQVVVELLWFLRGDTNVRSLQQQGVHIWDQWADPQGELGPVYGHAWRRWNDQQPVDQLAQLLQGIEQVRQDPEHSAARRLLLTAWNPAELPRIKGPSGCHTLAQFALHGGRLCCHLYQRSADLFLGVPWNIASYALLTHLLAHVSGLPAGELVHSFGDAHIYENHLEQVAQQLQRQPYRLPLLGLDPGITRERLLAGELRPDEFRLLGYQHYPRLSGEVAI